MSVLLPMLQGLTEPQSRLLLLLSSVIARHAPRDLLALGDQDIAEAAGTLAATLETSRRGVIYEHRAGTPAAQHLADDLKRSLDELAEDPGALTARDGPAAPGRPVTDRARLERDATQVLRRIEQAARDAMTAGGDSESRYRDLLGRVFKAAPAESPSTPAADSGLIVP